MKKLLIIIVPLLIIVAVVLWTNLSSDQKASDDFAVKVKSGEFVVDIITTGELEAINSEYIRAPVGLRNIRIHQIKINDIIPEGTVVDSGDYVATLDNSDIIDKLKDVDSELEKLRSQYTKTQLDTTLKLRQAREELVNLEYSFEEKELILEQSEFEPPATIRQNEIELEKSKRAFQQAQTNYKIKKKQAKADMREVAASLSQVQRKYDVINELLGQLIINAPKPGMVIYRRSWDGEKIKAGSTFNLWNNIVATLPDLSAMVSRTYVNEIDISKVKEGQKVEIEVDAFPDHQYEGIVTNVANIGEQRPNSDAKVFEVKIEVNQTDSILKPAMTTKNRIITNVIDSALFIPLEALHNDDSLTYVFKKNSLGLVKQQVITGRNNANEIMILAGLKADDTVLLTIPEDADDMKTQKLDKSVFESIDTSFFEQDYTEKLDESNAEIHELDSLLGADSTKLEIDSLKSPPDTIQVDETDSISVEETE